MISVCLKIVTKQSVYEESIAMFVFIPDEDDYNLVGQDVTFTSGTVNSGSECTNIEIIDDEDFETDQDFQVNISSITPSIASGTGDVASVTIQDNNGNFCC